MFQPNVKSIHLDTLNCSPSLALARLKIENRKVSLSVQTSAGECLTDRQGRVMFSGAALGLRKSHKIRF